MSAAIKVMLVDDQPAVRWLLRSTLEPDDRFEIVGEAGDGNEAVSVAEANHPDLAVLDLAMPNGDGLKAISEIRRTSPETRIVVLSGHAESMGGLARAHGAAGCVQKGREPEVLFREIARLFPEVFGATPADAPDAEVGPSPAPNLSTLLHDLQGELTIVYGFAATLRDAREQMDAEAVLACAEPIERSARELSRLIGGLPEAIAGSLGRTATEVSPY